MDTVPHLIALLDPQPVTAGDIATRLRWRLPPIRDPEGGLGPDAYLIPQPGAWEFSVWIDLPTAAGARLRCEIGVDGQVIGATDATLTGVGKRPAALQVTGADRLDVQQLVHVDASHSHGSLLTPSAGRLWGFWRSW